MGDAVTGSYRGQWLQGSRHGFGIRQSMPYGVALHYRRHEKTSHEQGLDDQDHTHATAATADDSRGGFVLVARSDPAAAVPGQPESIAVGGLGLRGAVARTLRLRKQASAGPGDGATSRVGRRAARDGSAGSRSASEDRESVHTDSCTSFISQVHVHTVSYPPSQRSKFSCV